MCDPPADQTQASTWPSAQQHASSSNAIRCELGWRINFTAGQTIANLVTTQNLDSGGGEIAIYNGSSGSVQIFVDEQGYFINQP